MKVKRGNFGRWGILELTILSSNYNVRQVNTKLVWHLDWTSDSTIYFDCGCKSSMYYFEHRCQNYPT